MALLAPLYFHASSTFLGLELLVILNELADVLGLYFIALFFIFSTSFLRDDLLQLYNSAFFKNYLSFLNKTELLSYFSHFFSNFRLNNLVLIKNIRSFFKNRKK